MATSLGRYGLVYEQVYEPVAAQQIGVGANSSGGVLGKIISPQNLAVGTSATSLQGKEGDLLRLVLKWSIGLTVVMAS